MTLGREWKARGAAMDKVGQVLRDGPVLRDRAAQAQVNPVGLVVLVVLVATEEVAKVARVVRVETTARRAPGEWVEEAEMQAMEPEGKEEPVEPGAPPISIPVR
jgi:hypothetical protein